MTRALEIVLSFPPPDTSSASETRASRARGGARDFCAELVRAWRIFPQMRMRRGHQDVTVERANLPVELAAAPAAEGRWQAWRETTVRGAQARQVCVRALVPGVTAIDSHQFGEAVVSPDAPAFTCERRTGTWHESDGRSVEIVLDDIDPDRPDSALHGYELRLSIADTDAGDARIIALRLLFAVARELCGAWPAFVEPEGVHTRLNGRDTARRPPLKAAPLDRLALTTQRDAFRQFGLHVATQWFGNLVGAHVGADPEYVHQLRVALRRLRTLARLFPRYADAAWKASFDADLRWFAERLGAARDWDVFCDSTLPALAAADPGSGDWEATRASAQARRAHAHAELRRAIASARYSRFALGWLEWLCVFHLDTSDNDARSLRHHAEQRVARLFERVRAAPPLSTLELPACHQVRIDTKRLRYALEFFIPLLDRRAQEVLLKPLVRIQSVLGEANDLDVGLQRFAELDVTPYQTGFAQGYAAAVQRRAVLDAEQHLANLSPPRFSRKKN